jgi:hypothetical protein
VRHIAADMTLLGVVRERVELDLSPCGEGASVSSKRPEQCRKQGAAVYVYPETSPSSGRRRLHRRPNVSQTATLPSLVPFLFLSLACERSFEPLGAGAPPLPPGTVDAPRLPCCTDAP